MADLSTLRMLMGEVRSLLGDEDVWSEAARPVKDKAKPKAKPKAKSKGGGGGGSEHSPFKRLKVIGPTPAGDGPGRVVRKKSYWSCDKVGEYTQMCTGAGGERKKVTIDQTYKARYNKKYKAWRKKNGDYDDDDEVAKK